MVHNRFRKYNTSLFVNVLMSEDYKKICKIYCIPKYNEINMAFKYGITALMCVCMNNNISIARVLLQHPKINVSITNHVGFSAIGFAIMYKNHSIVNLLHPIYITKNK